MDAVHDAEDKVYRENWSISTTWLALGVLPIPFAWLFVMGIVGTIKWIRRGFMSEANSNLPQGDNPH